jgi:anti-sigma B factor antagonist
MLAPIRLVPDFAFVVSACDGDVVLTARGDIDVATAPQLHAALATARSRPGGSAGGRVVVDLSQVTFLGAAGLRVLLAAARRARGLGDDLVLRDPRPIVLRLLEVTGMAHAFRVESRNSGVRHAA